ncbi:MAG: hypothetical protein P8X63_04560 [Desulfuromonadaceae bacterium]
MKTLPLRHIATALVLISLALPLSRCQKKVVLPQEEQVSSVATEEPVEFEYTYPHDWFELDEWTGWVALLTFAWPPLVLLARHRSRRLRESMAFKGMEVLLSAGGGYIIWLLSAFGERLVGFYVAISAMAIYLFAAGSELIKLANLRYQNRKAEQTHKGQTLN